MRRINLFEYFDLAEDLVNAKRMLGSESLKGGAIYFGISSLPSKLQGFIENDNGFNTCKHSAVELKRSIEDWIHNNVWAEGAAFSEAKFDESFSSWQYSHLSKKIEIFRSVFEAECHGVDVYSVGQVSIFKTRDLVAKASNAIPETFRLFMSAEAIKEFDDAGRCLAFDLPTACGFHVLRGTEIVMDDYLKSFGVTKKLVSWNDYIKAAEALISDDKRQLKPSKKVAAMLDRMRSLDRNPLMHPLDALDGSSAYHLFNLAAITVAEMIKDMRNVATPDKVALIAAKAGAELPIK